MEPAPQHGWTANGVWQLQRQDGASATFVLDRAVLGALVRKAVTLRAGDPWVYQCHTFTGGAGRVPVAHHAMLRAPGGAVLRFSAKQGGWTPTVPLETDPGRGRSILACPQRFDRLDRVAIARGGHIDASHIPWAAGHDDVLFLAEDGAPPFAWSSALAETDGYVFLAVKDARVLPFTGIWASNAGRLYPPWSGRHHGVVALEECRTGPDPGHRASMDASDQFGHAATLTLGGDVAVHYAFTAWPSRGWAPIRSVVPQAGTVVVTDEAGRQATLPYAG
ncbi:MAG: hypothetical protein H7Z10_07055 [Gemmatimonadaceae bacterium]|nr:hypothetical protein [Acetobacteraceae bacterium]